LRSAYRTGLIVAFPFVVWICQPHPLPTREGIAAMRWWAARRVDRRGAAVAGLLFVGQAGAGTFGGLTITANILMSLLIDNTAGSV
jgi:transporter family-2 protein